MNTEDLEISDLGLIDGNKALEILELSYKAQLQRLITKHSIPHVKVSRIWVFLKSDIETLKNSLKKNPRKIALFESSTDITKLGLIGAKEAIKIMETNQVTQLIEELLDKYDISYEYFPGAYVFLRSDIEKVQNSERRQKNLKYRKK